MQICIVAHYPLASALKAAASEITGIHTPQAIDLLGDQDPQQLTAKLEALYMCNATDEWLFLVDLLGGTPMHCLLPLYTNENVRVLSGANLPMLLAALQWKDFNSMEQWLMSAEYGIQEVSGLIKSLCNNSIEDGKDEINTN